MKTHKYNLCNTKCFGNHINNFSIQQSLNLVRYSDFKIMNKEHRLTNDEVKITVFKTRML
jgi:hypothetical protein